MSTTLIRPPLAPAAVTLDRLLAKAHEAGADPLVKEVVASLRAKVGKWSLSDYRRGMSVPKADQASRIHEITKPLRERGLHVKAYRWAIAEATRCPD